VNGVICALGSLQFFVQYLVESICYWSYNVTDYGDRPPNTQKNQGGHKETEEKNNATFKSLFKKVMSK